MIVIFQNILRMVHGIPIITNEAAEFNGALFTLSSFGGSVMNVLIKDCISHPRGETAGGAEKCQYETGGGYIRTQFSRGGTEYVMFIGEANNKVFVYNAANFRVGASLAGIGVKTMDLPVENIPLSMFENNGLDIKNAFETIHAMTGMSNGSACRLLCRELIAFVKQQGRMPFIMTVFQAPEFIAGAGAECWIRKDNGGIGESGEAEFINLPDGGITSTEALEGLRMSCIGIDGNYRLLSAWTGAGAVWLNGAAAFIKIDPDSFTFTGEPCVEIPVNAKTTLKNAALRSSLRMGENPTVILDGNSSITVGSFDSCIRCTGEVTVIGRGTLTLSCESHSAAIGCGGMSQSYGRYVPSREANPIKKVIVDGVHLEVACRTPNFSMGAYGLDNDVEIVLRNGGTVNGVPEAAGRVRLDSVGTAYSGSTKIEGCAVYRLEPAENAPPCGISAHPYAALGGLKN